MPRNRFYQELELLVPDCEDLDITVASQTVQRSAYPSSYADHNRKAGPTRPR